MRAFVPFVLFAVCFGVEIPKSLRNEARNAKTIEDFLKVARKYGPLRVKYSGHDSLTNRSYIIDSPKHGTSTCKLVETCVPVDVDLQTNQLFWPECVNLNRCEGGCCNFDNLCTPTDVKIYQVKIYIYTMDVGDNYTVDSIYVNMPEALGCRCNQQTECPVKPTFEECRCISRYEAAQTCTTSGLTSTSVYATTASKDFGVKNFNVNTNLVLSSVIFGWLSFG